MCQEAVVSAQIEIHSLVNRAAQCSSSSVALCTVVQYCSVLHCSTILYSFALVVADIGSPLLTAADLYSSESLWLDDNTAAGADSSKDAHGRNMRECERSQDNCAQRAIGTFWWQLDHVDNCNLPVLIWLMRLNDKATGKSDLQLTPPGVLAQVWCNFCENWDNKNTFLLSILNDPVCGWKANCTSDLQLTAPGVFTQVWWQPPFSTAHSSMSSHSKVSPFNLGKMTFWCHGSIWKIPE